MTDLSEAALGYAARGWPVLPLHSWTGTACTCGRDDCSSPAKHPRTANGLKDASVDPAVITEWWRRWPDANVGLRTGEAFDVLDVDGDPGIASIQEFAEANGLELPFDAPCSYTGGGGQHLLFQPTGVGNRAGLLPKVDWRGRNGYIVAPPSLHATGRSYQWGPDGVTELHPVPAVLLELVDPPRALPTTPGQIRRLPTGSGDGTPYGVRALEAELDELARAAQGTRNHTLNAVAYNLFQLVAGGELSENAVQGGLQATASNIGLNEREAAQTIGSARTAGLTSPRNAPELRMIGGGRSEVAAAVLDTAPDPWNEAEPEDQDQPQSSLDRLRSYLLEGDAIEQLPPPAPLVDGLLDLDSFAVMYGRPGSGKTHVALDIALRVATGAWWQKQPVTQGHVLYVVAEGAAGVGQRQLAWKHLNRHHASLNGQITWLPTAVHLLSPDNAHALATIAHEYGSSLVIIDTLARSMAGGDENSYKDMSLVIDACERIRAITGACVLLIHHTGKDQTAGGRGHSSLLGAVHTELEVKNAGDGIITLATTKQKDHADTAQPWRFVLAPAADSVAIATYTGRIPGDSADIIGKARDTLEALKTIDIPGGVTSGEWQGNSVQSGVSKSSFHIHRRSLLLAGTVQNIGSEQRPRYSVVTRDNTPEDPE